MCFQWNQLGKAYGQEHIVYGNMYFQREIVYASAQWGMTVWKMYPHQIQSLLRLYRRLLRPMVLQSVLNVRSFFLVLRLFGPVFVTIHIF